jgi:hypothetical protein
VLRVPQSVAFACSPQLIQLDVFHSALSFRVVVSGKLILDPQRIRFTNKQPDRFVNVP